MDGEEKILVIILVIVEIFYIFSESHGEGLCKRGW